MFIFLLTSFLALLVVGLILLIEPPKYGSSRRAIPWAGYIYLNDHAKIVLRRGVTALIVLCIFAVLWLLQESELSSRSRFIPNLLFGLLFGSLLAVWLGSVFRSSLKEGFSIGQSVQGIALIMLFVAGLLGAETARLIERYAAKLTKVSFGGTELSFGEHGRRGRGSSAESIVIGPSSGAQTLPNGSQGLGNLALLDTLIERDCAHIRLGLGREPQTEWRSGCEKHRR